MLLWKEYKRNHPDGIMYTKFCENYRQFKKANQITMHIEHKAGEEMQIDWAGDTILYMDVKTGALKAVYLFVAVQPTSNYPFDYAYSDSKILNFIDAQVRAYEYFVGVPKITIPDKYKDSSYKSRFAGSYA